jgi:superfamily I DNA/RNA helicase
MVACPRLGFPQEDGWLPVRIILKRGLNRLVDRPQVIIGTIHSVKGGEADVVYLFPDLSRAADYEWQRYGTENQDAIIRQFYVAMTRARLKLVICRPASILAVSGLR